MGSHLKMIKQISTILPIFLVTLAYGMPIISVKQLIRDALEAFGEPEGRTFGNVPPTNLFRTFPITRTQNDSGNFFEKQTSYFLLPTGFFEDQEDFKVFFTKNV